MFKKPHTSRQYLLASLLLSLFLMGRGSSVYAQDLNGVAIQVAADALTYMKFHDDVKRVELGNRDDYSPQVIEGNQLRIKAMTANPSPTNLLITEGSRTHMFIIRVMKKIDINNFKAYYDYSDLKALRKLVASSSTANAVAQADAADDPQEKTSNKHGQKTEKEALVAKEEKPDKKAQKQAEKERRLQEKAAQERANQEALTKQQQTAQDRKDQEELERKQAQAAKEKADAQQRELAAAKEKERLKQEAIAQAKEDAAAQKRLKAEQAKRDQEAAAAKAREEQVAKERQKEEALARQRAAAAEKQREKEEKEQLAREAQRKKEIAAAKEKDQQAAIAKADAARQKEEVERQRIEQARRDQQAKEDAIAQEKERKRRDEQAREAAAEKERQKQEAIARKQQEAIEQDRIRREEAIRQQQLAQEREKARREEAERQAAIAKEQARVRAAQKIAAEKARQEEQERKEEEARKLAAVKAAQRAEALIKNPYWKTQWHKKYPQINFAEGPVGQSYAGEYFLPKDTLDNSNAANSLVLQEGHLKKMYEEEKDGVVLRMVNIAFSGVNAYFQLQVVNKSDKDFLVGKMQLTWWKKSGGGFFLNPVYVTDFPVVSPGKEATIVFACRGVNARDEDDFSFKMSERITNTEIEIPFPGTVYNRQMSLQK